MCKSLYVLKWLLQLHGLFWSMRPAEDPIIPSSHGTVKRDRGPRKCRNVRSLLRQQCQPMASWLWHSSSPSTWNACSSKIIDCSWTCAVLIMYFCTTLDPSKNVWASLTSIEYLGSSSLLEMNRIPNFEIYGLCWPSVRQTGFCRHQSRKGTL